jgi:N-acetylmuramoyl-L-alanine amidase
VKNFSLKAAAWLLPILMGMGANAATAASLDYWRFNARLSRLEIVTDIDVKPTVQLVANPTRLVVDLPGINLRRPPAEKKIGRFVKEARVGQFTPRTVRLVVELGHRYTLRSQDVMVRGLAPNRWFIQLPKLLALDPSAAPQTDPIAIAVPDAKVATSPTDGVPITVPNPSSYPKGRVVIAIDPGHGGADPGAVGRGGLREKAVVLDISRKLAQFLAKNGLQAVLTRNEDLELDLAPRVAIAERAKARIFVSIHANALSLGQPGVNGLETYYYNDGYNLARIIHNTILRSISVSDRGVRRARFYVLRKTSMPAVLIETGYVTGRVDAKNLSSPNYRTRMAQAIGSGVLQYFR